MKKLAILTSILALAACGGGSGGGNGGVVPGAIEKPFVPIEDKIASSNAEITNMVSNSEAQVVTYVVNKLGTDAESVGLGNVARTAKSRGAFVPSSSAGDMNYDKAKELMELAQWLGDDTTTHDDITAMFNKSKADQNKIKSALKLLDDMYCYVGGSADETANRILERRANKDFDKPIEEIKDKSEIMVLDDATFHTTDSGELASMKFNVDENGKIISITNKYKRERPPLQDEVCDGPCIETEESTYTRYGDSDIFVISEKVEDAIDFGPEYVGKVVSVPQQYISYGKQLGLKYSDFGVMRLDLSLIEQEDPEMAELVTQIAEIWQQQDTAFIGGYDNKRINDKDVIVAASDGKIVFNGLAHANVSRYDFSLPGNGAEEPLVSGGMDDKNATLTVDGKTGTQTLAAKFDNWYDVQVVKNADGTDEFKFIGENKGGNEKFDDPSNRDDFHKPNDNIGTHKSVVYKTEYYGDNGNPTEAVAFVQHGRVYGPEVDVPGEDRKDWQYHLNINMGFGGTVANK